MTDREEARRLAAEIGAWETAVPFESGEGHTDAMRSTSQRLFNLAILISKWAVEDFDGNLFLCQSMRVESAFGYFCERGYVASQKRNGYEIWQAFLVVSHYGRIVGGPRADTIVDKAMFCARKCLRARMGQVGYLPWNLPPTVVVQVAEVDFADSLFAQSCLRSLTTRASTSYSLMWEARQVLSRTLRAIGDGHIGRGNVYRMRRALNTINQCIVAMDCRVVAVVQALHSRLGGGSPLMELDAELVSKIIGYVREA